MFLLIFLNIGNKIAKRILKTEYVIVLSDVVIIALLWQ